MYPQCQLRLHGYLSVSRSHKHRAMPSGHRLCIIDRTIPSLRRIYQSLTLHLRLTAEDFQFTLLLLDSLAILGLCPWLNLRNMAVDQLALPLSVEKQTYGSADKKDQIALQASESSGSEDNVDIASNPFLDPVVAAHWKEIYEEASYECRHVFDPTATWSEEEEKKIIRKLDWRVCLWAVSTTVRLP